MRADFGPIRILTPRAAHLVAAALRTHDLMVAMPQPALATATAPAYQKVGTLPAYLLVRKADRFSR